MSAQRKSTKPKRRIFLVDDHPIVRRGLQLLINLEPDLIVCGEADEPRVAFEQIARLRPDLAVIDLTLRRGTGMDLICQLRLQQPDLKILVLSMHGEAFYSERVLRAGAHGYLTKDQGSEKVIEAIHHIFQGKTVFSEPVLSRLVDRASRRATPTRRSPVETLSNRELEVLGLIGQGLKTRAIAARLGLSVKTIEAHREHLKLKLGLQDAAELAAYAFRWVETERSPDPPASAAGPTG